MTKDKFTRTINRIDKMLWIKSLNRGNALCWMMHEFISYRAFEVFNDLFKENNTVLFWWGSTFHKFNQEERHIALEMFYQTCLRFKLYKDFK